MDFLEKMGDTITAKGKAVADKAKVLAEIASLKSRLSACEEVMKSICLEIGKLYYEKYGDAPEAAFEDQCQAIANARNGARELREEIEMLKKC